MPALEYSRLYVKLALRLARLFGVPVESLFELAEPARPGKEKPRG